MDYKIWIDKYGLWNLYVAMSRSRGAAVASVDLVPQLLYNWLWSCHAVAVQCFPIGTGSWHMYILDHDH